MLLSGPLATRVCALRGCDIAFQPRREMESCCSERHGKQYWNDRASALGLVKPQPWNDKRKAAHQRRRAVKKGARTGAPVVAVAIYDRDRWRCQLCSSPIDRRLKWPHPGSASLDHVVPLSRDGAHDPSNVQAAHLRCNVRKNNRGGNEQLALC